MIWSELRRQQDLVGGILEIHDHGHGLLVTRCCISSINWGDEMPMFFLEDKTWFNQNDKTWERVVLPRQDSFESFVALEEFHGMPELLAHKDGSFTFHFDNNLKGVIYPKGMTIPDEPKDLLTIEEIDSMIGMDDVT